MPRFEARNGIVGYLVLVVTSVDERAREVLEHGGVLVVGRESDDATGDELL